MTSPDPALLDMQDVPEDEWDLDRICGGVWTIFPHISFAGGNGGGLISQLFPGPTPGEVDDDPELLRRRRAVGRPTSKRRWSWPTSSSAWYATRTTPPDCGCNGPSPPEPRSS